MKKKSKIIIVAILTIIILFLGIYVIYEKVIIPRLPSKTGIIVYKNEKTISLKDSEDSTQRSFALDIEDIKEYNPTIKDINGKKINFSDLNVGDKIKVIFKREKKSIAIVVYPETIHNIILIQEIEDNSDNHMAEDELRYNNYEVAGVLFLRHTIEFRINGINKFPNDYLSTECKIVQKSDNISIEDTEVKCIEPTAISSRITDNNSVAINIDCPNLYDELEPGKYVFIFDNKDLELIKIPFEVTINGNIQWLIR